MLKASPLVLFGALVAGSLMEQPAALASLVRALGLPALVAEANRIVVADVLSLHSAWDTSHRTIHTTVEIGIRESWKGVVPGEGRMTIRQLGGAVDEIEMKVHGMPVFARGERALLFLRKSQVVGMSQGKRTMRWQEGSQRWIVAPSASDSTITVAAGGRIARAKPELSQDLDQLRERVFKLVGR